MALENMFCNQQCCICLRQTHSRYFSSLNSGNSVISVSLMSRKDRMECSNIIWNTRSPIRARVHHGATKYRNISRLRGQLSTLQKFDIPAMYCIWLFVIQCCKSRTWWSTNWRHLTSMWLVFPARFASTDPNADGQDVAVRPTKWRWQRRWQPHQPTESDARSIC